MTRATRGATPPDGPSHRSSAPGGSPGAGQLHARVVTDIDELGRLRDDWERLWRLDSRRTPFGSFGWAQASWRAYGSARSLHAPVVLEGEDVVGILPLVVEHRTLGFLGAPRSDYNDIVCGPDRAQEIVGTALEVIADEWRAWDRIVFDNVSADSRLYAHLTADDRPRPLRRHVAFRSACPRIEVPPGDDELLLRLAQKKSLRRHQKTLSQLGTVRLRHLESRDEIRAHLPRFFEQHVTRRAMAGDRSLFVDERHRAFFDALVEELDPAAELRFAVVEVDAEPVAYHVGFEMQGRFVWYKPSFAIDLWPYSPGEVLIKHLLEYAARRNLESFDFTVGAEPFKARFANRVVTNYRIQMLRPGLRGAVTFMVGRARESLRGRPAVHEHLRRARDVGSSAARAARALVTRDAWPRLTAAFLQECRRRLLADDVRVFTRGPGWRPRPASGPHVGRATLSTLATLSLEHPDVLPTARLHTARHWLRNGDTPFVAESDTGRLHIAWLGLRSTLGDNGHRLSLERPSPVIFEHWTSGPRRDPAVEVALLEGLASHAARDGRECWVAVSRRRPMSITSLQAAGFVPRDRVRGPLAAPGRDERGPTG